MILMQTQELFKVTEPVHTVYGVALEGRQPVHIPFRTQHNPAEVRPDPTRLCADMSGKPFGVCRSVYDTVAMRFSPCAGEAQSGGASKG